MCPVILYRGDLMHIDPNFIQPFGDPFGIGIGDLSDQNFIAYGNDLCLQSFCL
jgi:hypothetical protein